MDLTKIAAVVRRHGYHALASRVLDHAPADWTDVHAVAAAVGTKLAENRESVRAVRAGLLSLMLVDAHE